LPTLEENNLWVRVTLPNTVDLKYSVDISNQLRTIFREQPETKYVSVQIGRPDDGTDPTGVFNQEYGVYFKAPEDMPHGAGKKQLIKRLQTELDKIPGLDYTFSQYIQDNVNEALSGVKGENSVKIFGPDLEVLDQQAKDVLKQLRKVHGIVDEGIFNELGQPTLNVEINREKCARFGINVSDVQALVSYSIGGTPITNIWKMKNLWSSGSFK